MPVIGFKMQLLPGHEEEYRRRHDALWPEMRDALKAAGVRRYSIFLDRQTLALFATLEIDDASRLDDLPRQPVVQKWWTYMRDIMETNPDHSPVTAPLEPVFYLE